MSDERYFFPNNWARLIFEAAEQVVGDKGVNSMLNMAGLSQYVNNYPPENMKKEIAFDDMGKLFNAIYSTYGKRGAQAISRIAGKNSFNVGVEKFGQLADAANAALSLSSPNAKMRTGLKFMARLVARFSDHVADVEEADDHFIYRVSRCPYCWDWKAEEPVCMIVVSNLQAALLWGTGKQFNIKEIECGAMGHDACVYRIDKTPIG